MFVSIIQSFLRADSTSIDDRLLKLELLAYNFHESLNLKPLFFQLERDAIKSGGAKGGELRDRLSKVAREVTRKEMVVLEEAGKSLSAPSMSTISPAIRAGCCRWSRPR